MRPRSPFTALKRGIGLIEVALAVALATLIIFGICQVTVNEIRVEKAISIAKANNEVMQVESHRLRNIPLSGFYKDTDLTALRGDLVYYRLLPLPIGDKGSSSGRLFAEVAVKITQVKDIDAAGKLLDPAPAGTPVEVTLTVSPVYHKGQPVWAIPAVDGVAMVDKSEFSTTAGETAGSLDLRGMVQKISFIVL